MSRSADEKGADKANAVRKSQQKDRVSLAKDIETNQKVISQLNDESAPIRAENRKVEAEVGPIKYIAAFIYGTNPDASLLEQAVTWIIILIVIVFDPLAVIMLLASQMTFGWAREQKEDDQPTIAELDTFVGEKPTPEELEQATDPEAPPVEPAKVPSIITSVEDIVIPTVKDFEGVRSPGGEWIQTGPEFEVHKPEELTADSGETISELDKWNRMIEEAEKEVAKQETTVEERLATGQSYIDSEGKETPTEATLPEPDFPIDESKKKDLYDQRPYGSDTNKDEGPITYVQNSEQSTGRLWSRLVGIRPIDQLYKEYGDHEFDDFVVDETTEPELYNFVQETKLHGPKFSDYPEEKIAYFEERIHELRKNNPDNSTR